MNRFNTFVKLALENDVESLPIITPVTDVEIITDQPVGCTIEDIQHYLSVVSDMEQRLDDDLFKGHKTSLEYALGKVRRALHRVLRDNPACHEMDCNSESTDNAELEMGIDDEAEEHEDVTHGDKDVAEKIAKGHLKQNPKYYTKLKKCGL